MKTIASVLTALVFAAAAHAEDSNKESAAGMTAEPTQPAAAATPAPAPGTVARAAVTTGVADREPIDNLADVTTETDKVYYFTELRGMEGQTVTHRWEHNGETMAEVAFQIGGPRWRVYSSKNLTPDWTGEWKVSVLDSAGNTLRADTFMYMDASASGAMSGGKSEEATATGAAAAAQASATR